MRKNFFAFLILMIFYSAVYSQQITYTQPEPQDSRALDFQIIGKIHDNFLIYKNIRSNYSICTYDNSMRLLNRINMNFMPEKTLNVDFVLYPDFAYMIYQYQRRNTVYCDAVKINSDGKLLADPVQLDTTHINFFANNKIYSSINSEDKSKIMIYKIQRKTEGLISLHCYSMTACNCSTNRGYKRILTIKKICSAIFLWIIMATLFLQKEINQARKILYRIFP